MSNQYKQDSLERFIQQVIDSTSNSASPLEVLFIMQLTVNAIEERLKTLIRTYEEFSDVDPGEIWKMLDELRMIDIKLLSLVGEKKGEGDEQF